MHKLKVKWLRSAWKTDSQINNAAVMNYADISFHSHLFLALSSVPRSQMKRLCRASFGQLVLTGWQRCHPLDSLWRRVALLQLVKNTTLQCKV